MSCICFQGFVSGVFCGCLCPHGQAITCNTVCEDRTTSQYNMKWTLKCPSTLGAPTSHNTVWGFKLDVGRKNMTWKLAFLCVWNIECKKEKIWKIWSIKKTFLVPLSLLSWRGLYWNLRRQSSNILRYFEEITSELYTCSKSFRGTKTVREGDVVWNAWETRKVFIFNHLKTKRNLFYIRNQALPRSKHFPPRL